VNAGPLIFAVGGLLATSLGGSLVAARLRVPALLLFLAVGVAAGENGAGWITFNDYALAREVGIAALALILFDGGLNTGFSQIKSVLGSSLRLAVGGTIIVALVAGVAASALLGLPPLQGLLLGSILASTDSAAVFGLLRGSTLRPRLVRTMEAETGFNDAVVLVLVLGFVAWIEDPRHGLVEMFALVGRDLALGAVCGFLVAKAASAALSRAQFSVAGLYSVASFAAATVAYGAAVSLHGSGLLAVYLTGLLLADSPIRGRRTIAVFHDGLAWVAQVALFLMLGLLVSPTRLEGEIPEGLMMALVVVLFARPLATFAMTTSREFSVRERLVLSWAELVGASPIIFASVAVVSRIAGSVAMFDLVCVAVIVSTLLQGLTFERFARVLGLTQASPILPQPLVELGGAARLGAELLEYPVNPTDGVVGRRVRDLDLPLGITLPLIVREEEAVSPNALARIKTGDTLHFLVREEVTPRIPELIARLREPGLEPTIARRQVDDGGLRDLLAEPWTAADGDPADPEILAGTPVAGFLRARTDRPGALVVLEDGRYAVTGTTLAVGPAAMVRRYANRRLTGAFDGADAAWWHDVAASLRS
jgi:cell volume regulation protein A